VGFRVTEIYFLNDVTIEGMRTTTCLIIIIALWSCQNKTEDLDKVIKPVYEGRANNVRLSIETTDSLLAASFKWAAQQAMSYVHNGSDPVGLWYEAALPEREAFCMRDVAHQSTGAHLLGLAAHNKNMLLKFAKNISESKDWCTYWEINRYNLPAPVDYRNDKEFWYNLPANYDVIDACYRQYLWTGDVDYLQDTTFQNFYQHSMEDYTARWQLGLNEIMLRDRWINTPKPLDSGDYFHIARGLPSYEEGDLFKMQVGADLLGFQYRAYLAWAEILDLNGEKDKATEQRSNALNLKKYFITEWLNDSSKTFYRAHFSDRGFVSKPSQFLLYTGIAHADGQIDKEVARLVNFGKTNIESQSYLPLILFRYDQNKEAYAHVLDLSSPGKKRREYPEVSFAVIESIISGLAGVEANAASKLISTLPRMSEVDQQLAIKNIPIFSGEIDLTHLSPATSILLNKTGEAISWKARFYGQHKDVYVNGKKQKANTMTTDGALTVSFIELMVRDQEEINVSVLK